MEPMDIDKSFNSSHSKIEDSLDLEMPKCLISENSQCPISEISLNTRNIKKIRNTINYNYRVPNALRAQTGYFLTYRDKWLMYIITFFTSTCMLFIKYGHFEECSVPQVDVQKLMLKLDQSVHGQDQAIQELEAAFIEKDNFQVTILIGPTGTGKTHVSNVIATFFGNTDNVFRFTSNSQRDWTAVNDCIGSLIKCSRNVVIIDDLTVENNDIPQILPILQWKSFNLNLKIHVMVIYTGNETSNLTNILNKVLLGDSPILHVVHFNPMDREGLDECIKNALHVRGLRNVKNFEEISLDYDVEAFGCKSIYNKVSLLL